MKTYHLKLSKYLGIEFEGTIEGNLVEEIGTILPSNYRTYGGGGAGEFNAFYGKKHTDETKLRMKELKKNYIPWNVGIKGYSVHTEESKKVMSEKLSGSKNGRALLNENDVKTIIDRYLSKPEIEGVGKIQGNGLLMSYEWAFCIMIAEEYNLSSAAVKRLLRKKSWKNVWSEYESKNQN